MHDLIYYVISINYDAICTLYSCNSDNLHSIPHGQSLFGVKNDWRLLWRFIIGQHRANIQAPALTISLKHANCSCKRSSSIGRRNVYVVPTHKSVVITNPFRSQFIAMQRSRVSYVSLKIVLPEEGSNFEPPPPYASHHIRVGIK